MRQVHHDFISPPWQQRGLVLPEQRRGANETLQRFHRRSTTHRRQVERHAHHFLPYATRSNDPAIKKFRLGSGGKPAFHGCDAPLDVALEQGALRHRTKIDFQSVRVSGGGFTRRINNVRAAKYRGHRNFTDESPGIRRFTSAIARSETQVRTTAYQPRTLIPYEIPPSYSLGHRRA